MGTRMLKLASWILHEGHVIAIIRAQHAIPHHICTQLRAGPKGNTPDHFIRDKMPSHTTSTIMHSPICGKYCSCNSVNSEYPRRWPLNGFTVHLLMFQMAPIAENCTGDCEAASGIFRFWFRGPRRAKRP